MAPSDNGRPAAIILDASGFAGIVPVEIKVDPDREETFPVVGLLALEPNDLAVEAQALRARILEEEARKEVVFKALIPLYQRLIAILVPALPENRVRRMNVRKLAYLSSLAWAGAGGPLGRPTLEPASTSSTSSPDSPASTAGATQS